ncbi:PEP-CTERM sorting domain-containing protein [Roseateles sp.]|uniref:PEP-CTERM sorting domain-containing protein n=1 Tax=Roseateles sp. TaxID=1971397 RepID=UPI002F3F159F
MFKQAKLALAAMTLAAATLPAMAAPLYINTGQDFVPEPNGSTNTTTFDQLGYSGTLATSIYLGSPATPGTTVIDTNIPSVMNFYGFSAGTHTTLSGGSASFNYPNAPAQTNIDSLNNPTNPSDLNGFVGGVGFPAYGFGNVGGLGGAWGLTYSYQIVGKTVDSNGDGVSDYVAYTGGVFSVFYQSAATDPNNGKEVLRLIVTGSQIELTNLNVEGYVDYSYAGGDTFVQNFFNSGEGLGSLYSNWLNNSISVSWVLDTNVDPPIPTPAQLYNSGAALIRQSTLDGSLVINVPEPGTLALVGLALAGVGFAQRRRALRK